jgi:hypothetical protein
MACVDTGFDRQQAGIVLLQATSKDNDGVRPTGRFRTQSQNILHGVGNQIDPLAIGPYHSFATGFMTQAQRGKERLWIIAKVCQKACGKDVGLDLVSQIETRAITPCCQFGVSAGEIDRPVFLNDMTPATRQAIGQFDIAGFKQGGVDGHVP